MLICFFAKLEVEITLLNLSVKKKYEVTTTSQLD